MPFVRAIALSSLLLLAAAPARAVDESDFCAAGADPCEFSGDELAITADTTLDFGTRTLIIGRSKRIALAEGITLTIEAGSFVMKAGARIGNALVGRGGNLTVTVADDIVLEHDAIESRSRVEVPGSLFGGNILFTAGGNIEIDGELRSNGTAADGSGGLIDLEAGGAVTVAGIVNLKGGDIGSGGEFISGADGPLIVSAPVDASGGSEGGIVDLSTNGSLTTTATLDVRGTTGGGLGGSVGMDVLGSITLGGKIFASGAGSLAGGGGFGSDFVDLIAGASIYINESIDLSGGAPEGFGGSATFTADVDIIQKRSVLAIGGGTGGIGGDITYTAGRNLSLEDVNDVSGADQGGDVDANASVEIRVTSDILATGGGIGGGGGTIELEGAAIGSPVICGNVIVADRAIRTRGTAAGGSISIQGFDVTIAGPATLNNAGTDASNLVQASGLMTIAGRLEAGPAGANVLQFRVAGQQPVLTGATFDPAPVTSQNSALRPCQPPPPPVCGDGEPTGPEGCDDGNLESCDGCSGGTDGETCHAAGCCQVEACGDGVKECDEDCDDDNVVDGDGCDSNCTPTRCGNGRVTAGEDCDDGNTSSGDGCSDTCIVEPPPGCGDGSKSDTEECDDGNKDSCDGCSKLCIVETCGNGVRECAEICDDAGTLPCDGECAADCSRTVDVCGDSITECGEECDAGAGNGAPGSACSGFCRTCAIGSGADCPCGTDFDCSPAGRCAGLACLSGACSTVEVPACNDNNACNGVEACVNGDCSVPSPPVCIDDDPCTDDACTPAAGCPHARKTGIPGISCRLEFIVQRATDATGGELATKLRAKILTLANGAANRITSAGQETRTSRQRKLLKAAEKQLAKLSKAIAKGLKKSQIDGALASRFAQEADGALSAAKTFRAGITG
jgi:cysteine-rich repeat protein